MKMNKRDILFFSLLVFGLLFSATIVCKFNLSQGFEFKGLRITSPVQIIDLAVQSSSELMLTSQLIGYLFYLTFGILCLKTFGSSQKTRQILILFFGLIGLVFLSEIYSFYQDFNNQYTGHHFRIGFTIFLLGLVFYWLQIKELRFEKNQ